MTDMLSDRVRSDVQRILNRAARRQLRARLERDPITASAGSNERASDDGPHEISAFSEGEIVPVVGAQAHGR